MGVTEQLRTTKAAVDAALSWADGPGKTDLEVEAVLSIHRRWICGG